MQNVVLKLKDWSRKIQKLVLWLKDPSLQESQYYCCITVLCSVTVLQGSQYYTEVSIKAMCSWSFVHSHFFEQKPQCGMHWLFDYLLRFVNFFLCYFFSKTCFKKDYLTQGNLLKMLLNEKQSHLEKEM